MGIVLAGVVFHFLFSRWPTHPAAARLGPLFDLNSEENVPSFFTGCLFLAGAVLFAFVRRAAEARDRPRALWGILALVFPFLAFDELFGLHERWVAPGEVWLGTSGWARVSWFVFYGPIVVALTIAFLPEWKRLGRGARRRLGAAAATYLTGAMGLEVVEAYAATRGRSTLYLEMAEESLEMAGLILLVYGLIRLLGEELGGFAVVIAASREPASSGRPP